MKYSREIKAGAIAVLAIVGFVLLFQFMKGKSIFTTADVYYAKYDNVQGLRQSSAVSINGLKVGQVDKITPQTSPDGKIYFIIKLLIDNEFKFSKKSTLEIFEAGLMSDKEIRVNLAYDGEQAKSGDTLRGNLKLGLMDGLSAEVAPVKDQVQSVLTKADSLLANANAITDAQNRAELRAILVSLNKTISSFEQTSAQTNKLLAESKPKINNMLDNANLATLSAKNTIDKFGNVADNVDVAKLNGAIERLSATAEQLNKVIAGIQNGEGSLGKLTKDEQLYNNLEQTSKNLNELLIDFKANPKRYVNISVFGKSSK